MARRRRPQHEEHTNHEAWAIPYGDLVTLLLAFFVVMYAVSSLNEGKYRVLSDSLFAAFRGSPRTLEPVQVGEKEVGAGAEVRVAATQEAVLQQQPRQMLDPAPIATQKLQVAGANLARQQLDHVALQVEEALRDLIENDLLAVRRNGAFVEVEIRTDILFSSGAATLAPAARDILRRVSASLQLFANPIRVEGHTDNRPINTSAYPSNWELSSARAASVVHLFTETGIDPSRLAVIGLGEFRPRGSNDTAAGRNANRRVVLVILDSAAAPEGSYANDRAAIQGNTAAVSNDTEPAPVAAVAAVAVQTATE